MVSNGELAEAMDDLRATHGETVSLGDIAEVVTNLMDTVTGDLGPVEAQLDTELKELIEYIQRARSDIAGIDPKQIREQKIPQATDELDAVVAATEMATDSILDVAEQLEQLSSEVGSDHGSRISDLATQIYEASNFQDITGQRITKVVSTLQHIEAKLLVLARIVDGVEVEPQGVDDVDGVDEPEDADLLNGPGMPDAANSQDDIDALLASFD